MIEIEDFKKVQKDFVKEKNSSLNYRFFIFLIEEDREEELFEEEILLDLEETGFERDERFGEDE